MPRYDAVVDSTRRIGAPRRPSSSKPVGRCHPSLSLRFHAQALVSIVVAVSSSSGRSRFSCYIKGLQGQAKMKKKKKSLPLYLVSCTPSSLLRRPLFVPSWTWYRFPNAVLMVVVVDMYFARRKWRASVSEAGVLSERGGDMYTSLVVAVHAG
ncbi:hypothetical protein SODALDRAFT_211974 [Sodiomyces alkalinus F11]|uniref:Uncharacterized protein n=1 Tax=Sodiomyces alkalinus (strain CBS 110278 / VKM F-3762 / F11) TaxID=1314773 RepID=A0A3N2PR65_SODAK|nr:hypothetical protein SODALDRAFT_211974 [Sodiomyces alkalinus F11]ROT36970.1 hypothetical protein SODALDRAFT_211974 [Sodiomyces alkalinus F11]